MKELPKIYEPQKVEDEIYARWEQSGCFNPDNIDSKEAYCNILPPPNANGELHIGHASGYTVMDIFGRYARMNGKKTLLLPGKDHAGIQTQVVFEKKIQAELGLSRQEIGREDFYKKTYDFCIDRANYMRSQEKKIGISADWSREKFTLDPDVLKTALETFVKMHEDGLIYKGKRIINWCPRCGTALSDVEVLHKETPGKLYFIKYPLENSTEFITVATTRPETMLGDTAVAVNPKDKHYSKLVGKNIVLPLQNTIIPIIADKRIDLSFGTGAVKITPSHDPLDWEIGKDHKLAEIQIIDEKALITDLGGKYAGLTTHEAREEILKDLEKLNLLEKIEEMTHSVSICERCKTIIEPLTSNQWFVNVNAENYSLKKEAIKSIESGMIEIFPSNFKKILADWFGNLHDWCISRQIWWGPQFPVWYCNDSQLTTHNSQPKCSEPIVSIEKIDSCPHCGGAVVQDENTLDTWFTSSQWPYTTLKSNGKDFETFFSSDMMIMGRDLLFFWSSRMIMMSLYTTKKVPFKNLFFTGLVLDKDGHKFSKSRGNGIDPLTVIDKFGADALRMSLIMDSAPGQNSRLYEEKIETFRNFANKLWNISRYCLSQENFKLVEDISEEDINSEADRWIAESLNELIGKTNQLFESKQISVAADLLKTFTWNSFADGYIEAQKIEKNEKMLGYVLDKLLKLWHPFIPFVTEHIWTLAGEKELLMISKWPAHKENKQTKTSSYFPFVLSLNKTIRNVRKEKNIESTKKIELWIETTSELSKKVLLDNADFIKKSAGISVIKFNKTLIGGFIQRVVGECVIKIPLDGLVDVEKEKTKAEKEIVNLEKFIAGSTARLSNKDFVSKAPAEVISQQKETLERKQAELAELKKHLASL
ncbi:MAG: Valine-tRNA ligase [Candidatus Moranbacteria bacterium GW2011_GWE1_36_7]|nr:MAG: Valine-tRNA ligase [Candidatus Moranbacteria bacterium GW2011_GWD2_36_12]KKQ05517.1 MAG: Valine-tRNA ligase [Candidatus Moranbacteria bacterium GW2011_GWE2_36_40]KKQ14523.1 MAG: Valine-tRNA ligase [Candidatus Moranbacteria bacterium GW2011_GWE1_36_7]